MKKFYLNLKFLLLLIFSLSSSNILAYDYSEVNSDGKTIYYDIISTRDLTASVVRSNYSYLYDGDINIPSTIEYAGNTYSVITIEAKAFQNCFNITSITIPNSVTTIGSNAFDGCYGLTTLTIPSSVTKIENSAFNLCTKLSTLIIEDGVENLTLGYNSYNSSGVGRGLFYDCPIDTLYLGRDISYYTSKESGYSPFYDLPTLTSVIIGDRVTRIGSYTFSNCTNLSSIDLPENITTIGSYAFSNCTNLSSIIISDGLSSIGTNAFLKTPFLLNQPTDTLIYFGKVLYKYNGTMPADTDIEIQQGTLSIAGSAFSGCEGLTNITIPNSVKIVGANAFNGCSGLTSITIPESVTSIEKDAFGGCSSLSNLVFENGDNDLGIASIEMFSSCPLKTLYLGRNVEYPLFSGKDLISVVIGKSVTQIPTNTFTGCSEIKSIVFEDGEVPLELGWSEQSISNSKGLFYNSSYLEYLYIGRDLIQLLNNNTTYKKENNSPFSRCYSLYGVTFGETVTTIPDYIFYNGTATHITCLSSQPYIINDNTFLTEESSFPHEYMEIAVPIGALETYKSADFWKRYESICMFYIKDGIEYNIYEDKSIVYRCYDDNISEPNIIDKIEVDGFDYNITEIRYGAFADHSNLTSVTIPNGITSIGNSAFWNCDSLSSITIPNSVTSIGEGVFVGCTSLTSITIPENVQHIGGMAFRDCTGLQEIYSLNPTPPSSPADRPSPIFYNVDKSIPIYIPYGTKSDYQMAFEWNEFTNFIEIEVDNSEIKYCSPSGNLCSDCYLRSVTTSGADVNISYNVNSHPGKIYLVLSDTIKVTAGKSITLNLVANSLGLANWNVVHEDIRYCHASLFTDFDINGEFGAPIKTWGNNPPEHNIYGNYDECMNISTTIDIPATAPNGTSHMRVIYTNAWGDFPTACTSSIDKGIAYDFVIEVTDSLTGLSECSNDNVEIYKLDETLNIKNYNGRVKVVNLSGQVVKDFYVNGYAQITLPKGIYIVVTENNTQKVVL